MTTITKYIVKKREEAAAAEAEADRLYRLSACYPDLRYAEGRWGKIAWCSASVNAVADQFEWRYNCGCCTDSPLEVWLFAETADGRVNTDPPYFTIGEKHDGLPRLDGGWRDRLQAAGIRPMLIEVIASRFTPDHAATDDDD